MGPIVPSLRRTTALGYVRVSTDEQTTEGVSLEAQAARIAAYAVAKDLELIEVIRDEGLSGKDLKRTGLTRLLAACEAGDVGAVIVVKLDRLTRRTRDLLTLVEDLFLARRVELHSVSESLDTSTPHGRFVLTLFGGLAQMERELVAERTQAALEHKRNQLQPTSDPPLGFRANGKRKRMLPVPEEAAAVARILELRRTGSSYRAIAAQLNQQGYRTKYDRRWYHTTVAKVVRRQAFYLEHLGAA